jgi:hypothetical protein
LFSKPDGCLFSSVQIWDRRTRSRRYGSDIEPERRRRDPSLHLSRRMNVSKL